jgi:hypothetical protein
MTYSWLVENFTKEGNSTGLYMACQVNMTVTADVNAARKFRRQRTAEFRALDMREARRGDWRAAEHGFDDTCCTACLKRRQRTFGQAGKTKSGRRWQRPRPTARRLTRRSPARSVRWIGR